MSLVFIDQYLLFLYDLEEFDDLSVLMIYKKNVKIKINIIIKTTHVIRYFILSSNLKL